MAYELAGVEKGRLIVLRRATAKEKEEAVSGARKVKKKSRWWLVKCVCGTEKLMPTYTITSSPTKSCGCLIGENNGNRQPKGKAAFRGLLNDYRQSAKQRGLNFRLSESHFRKLTSSACHYCGRDPVRRFGEGRYNGAYVHNGIDRKNPTKGYRRGNVVPCCKRCNYAKRSMSYKDFRGWVREVADHLGMLDDVETRRRI